MDKRMVSLYCALEDVRDMYASKSKDAQRSIIEWLFIDELDEMIAHINDLAEEENRDESESILAPNEVCPECRGTENRHYTNYSEWSFSKHMIK